MFRMFSRYSAVILLMLSSLTISAQLVNITGVVFPGLPATSCTNTFVDVSLQLNCANMTYQGASTSVSGSTITVNLSYTLGPICLGALVFPTENVNMGMIPAGTYTVVVNGILNGVIDHTQNTSLTVNSCCSATPSFTASMDTICPGDSAYFNNTSTGATSQAWYVNNTQVSTNMNHGQVFPMAGTYDIKLVVSAASCSDSVTEKLYVIAGSSCCPTVPGFTASQSSGCAGDSIYFTNTSTGATSYKWYVGSNQVSTGNDYGQVFNTGGSFMISLVASDGNCSDSITQTIQVTDPMVDLGPDTMICKSATVLLVAGFAYDSVMWSDGSTGPTLTTGPGTVYVDVYKNGCPASDTVVVSEVPIVPADLGPDTILCVGDSLVLDVTRTGGTYLWQDGSMAGSITVSDSGTYWVEVTDGVTGCTTSDTIEVGVDSCNSNLVEIMEQRLELYPQPAGEIATLRVPIGFDLFTELRVLDMNGSLVGQVNLNSWNGALDLNLSNYKDGVYILLLEGETISLRKKLTVKRQ